MKKHSIVAIFLLLIFLIPSDAYSQFFNTSQQWKQRRHEIGFGAGLTNFRGDLAVVNRNTGKLFLFDIEHRLFRHGLSLDYRYNISQRQALKASFFHGQVVGDDQYAQDIYRNYRNLSFKSNIYEFLLAYEYFILRPKSGALYNIQEADGFKNRRWEWSLLAGAGFFYFNPRAEGENLREMSTEGQGLPGGAPAYSPFAFSLAFGSALYYNINKNYKIGIEYSYRFTNTDYIDDVSTVYYDKEIIRQAKGDKAAFLSDRSSGENPNWTATGQQRGDPNNNDGYFSILFKLFYTFDKRR